MGENNVFMPICSSAEICSVCLKGEVQTGCVRGERGL